MASQACKQVSKQSLSVSHFERRCEWESQTVAWRAATVEELMYRTRAAIISSWKETEIECAGDYRRVDKIRPGRACPGRSETARATGRKDFHWREIVGQSAAGGSRDRGGSPAGLCGESQSVSSWFTAWMKVFGDTVYFIALLSTGDRWHAEAVAISRGSPGS
jgi:hypothetical protein